VISLAQNPSYNSSAPRYRTQSFQNCPSQNTDEIESHYLLYAADDCEASETRKRYAAELLTSY